MLIDVYDENLTTGRVRLVQSATTVDAILGDDHEDADRVHRDLASTGRATYGGGAAPFFIIMRAR